MDLFNARDPIVHNKRNNGSSFTFLINDKRCFGVVAKFNLILIG